MPNFLSPRFSTTLRRTLISSSTRMRMTGTPTPFSRLNNNPSNSKLNHHFLTPPPPYKPPHHRCSPPKFDVGVGFSSSSVFSNNFCTASENRGGNTKPDPERLNLLKGWDVPWSLPVTLLATAIADTSSHAPFMLASKVCQYFKVAVGPNVNGIIQLGVCCIAASVLFGVIFGVIRFYKPIPKDLFYWSLKEPFNLRKGWLLWAIIGLVFHYGPALAGYRKIIVPSAEEKCKEWWYILLHSTNFSAFCVFGCMSVVGPIAEEVLHRGFLLASLTKWVPTPVAVMISSAVFAIIHRDPDPNTLLGHYIMGTILGMSYVQTRNLMTPFAIHCFTNTSLLSFYMSK